MPIYEYICRDCGEQFETMTTMAKADEVACKACESENTERKFSVFGVTASTPKHACGSNEMPRGCPSAGGGGGCGGGSVAVTDR